MTYHSWYGAHEEHNSSDTSRQESNCAASQTETDKDVGRIIDDYGMSAQSKEHRVDRHTGINSTPLLEEHHQPGGANPLEVVHGGEAVGILRPLVLQDSLFRRVGEGSLLKQGFGFDLEIFHLDKIMFDRQFPHPGERGLSLLVSSDFDQPPRREGHKPDPAGQCKSRDSLNDGGQTPCQIGLRFTSATNVITAIAHPEGNHDPQDGCELIEGYQETAHLRSSQFGIVQGANTAEKTDSQTGKESSSVQERGHSCRSTDVQITSKDDPAACRKHGVLSRKDLAEDARR